MLCTYRTDRDQLIRVIHHGDEKIEEHDDVDDGEAAEHGHTPEPGELLDSRQLEVIQVDQTKACPEQSLRRLPQADENISWLGSEDFTQHVSTYFANFLKARQ